MRLGGLWICRLLLLFLPVLAGCTKLSDISTIRAFNAFGVGGHSSKFQGDEPFTIDAGAYEVNNDTNVSCTGMFGGLGCMQPPSLVYSDSRWHVGFAQNYLSDLPTTKFSLMVAMSTIGSYLFGAFGTGLNIVDTGLGLSGNATASSRYVQFAKLDNGDVVAIYYLEDIVNDRRMVFASTYSATSKTWSSGVQLSTTAANVITDRGVDHANSSAINVLTLFCKPQVTSGGSSALASWCEDDGTNTSRVVYSIYSNGSWSTSGGATAPDVADYSDTAFPGFSALTQTFSGSMVANDIVSSSIAATTTVLDIATVKAVTTSPSAGQFKIETNSLDGSVLMCSTLQNMITAILAKTVQVCSPACVSSTQTLAELGVSMSLDPNCSNTSTANWRISTYYNKALTPVYRTVSGTPTNVVNAMTTTSTSFVLSAGTNFATQDVAQKSAMVAVAGDGSGNFAMVRSVVAPFFHSDTVNIAQADKGRMLVGHQYLAGSGWVQRASATGADQAETSVVSLNPECYTAASSGSVYSACSVKHPKFLMSTGGNGLILFYQNQVQQPNTVGTPVNPNRLWFATYSNSTGFSRAQAPLDEDSYCSSTATVNDLPVCETGSATTGALACQSIDEVGGTTSVDLSYPTGGFSLVQDIPPIAADMNVFGRAIVVYHKPFSDGSTCDKIGTYARFVDTNGSLSSVVQLDDQTGATLHAQAAINSDGNAAVVWEQIVDTNHYVYLKIYKDGIWSATEWVNKNQAEDQHTTIETNSMMPSVGYNDDGEIIVAYTLTVSGVRRQYVRQYYEF